MQTIDKVIIVAYLLIMILVGLFLQKRASKGIDSYFLADRKLPWWALGASGMASNLDVAGTMMLTGFVYSLGMNGFWLELRGSVGLYYVFIMIFMGKWCRRSGVMTSAEWMTFRFGSGADGKLARMISALSAILFTVVMVAFFSKGAGKFVAELLDVPSYLGVQRDFWAALGLIVLAMIYTVSSGLQGVVWTDVLQGALIFIVIAVVCVMAMTDYKLPSEFNVSSAVVKGKTLSQSENRKYTLKHATEQDFIQWKTSKKQWASLWPKDHFDFPEASTLSVFNLFLFTLLFYFMKVFFDGMSGAGGYVFQRLLAAKNEKEVGLMMMFWIFLSSFRWPLIVSLAMMGVYLSTHSAISDPDMVLPLVINQMIPTGLKGILVAGLLAAAMSTFDSTVNNGASFWVKDIYQAHINPNASEKKLVQHSRWASILIVVLALLLSVSVRDLGQLWSWIAISLSAGLFVPMLTRWYWWRLTGYGFSAGVLVGMLAGIGNKLFLPDMFPEHYSFLIACSLSLIATIVVTYITKPIDFKILENFYVKTRPFGFWRPVKSLQSVSFQMSVRKENTRDFILLFIAIPWMLSLYLLEMSFVTQNYPSLLALAVVFLLTSILLYKYWFKELN